jgi:hypothetical protein
MADFGAADTIYPIHLCNCLAMLCSVIFGAFFLFASPHRRGQRSRPTAMNDLARMLDRKLASFAMSQIFTNSVIAVVMSLSNCTSSESLHFVMQTLNIVLRLYLSIWHKNLVSHVYLYKRAKTVADSVNGGHNQKSSLRKLRASFNIEIKSLYLGLIAAAAYPLSKTVGFFLLVSYIVLTFLSNAAFSVLAVAIFLRPLQDVLNMARVPVQAGQSSGRAGYCQGCLPVWRNQNQNQQRHASEGHKFLSKKRRNQMIGVTLFVMSMALLNTNLVAFMFLPMLEHSLWLNVMVIAFPADSVLTTTGMFWIAGFEWSAPFRALVTLKKISKRSSKSNEVLPAASSAMVFVSNAHEGRVPPPPPPSPFSPSSLPLLHRLVYPPPLPIL